MRAHLDDADLDAAARYERRFRHDVMAHIHAYADQAPAARPYLHLGATSAFVTDNADLILMRDGLRLAPGTSNCRLARARAVRPSICRPALPGVHPLPAGPAYHRWKAGHAMDAGLRPRRRGDVSPDRDATAAGLQGYDRDAGLFPSSCSAGTTRRSASSTGGWR